MLWDIDTAMNAFGFKTGNFQISDLAGLDIGCPMGRQQIIRFVMRFAKWIGAGKKQKQIFYDNN